MIFLTLSQPLQVLRLLLEADGKVVTREQLRSVLWTKDTFVDLEHGVNTAIKKLRRALKDSAESPRFHRMANTLRSNPGVPVIRRRGSEIALLPTPFS